MLRNLILLALAALLAVPAGATEKVVNAADVDLKDYAEQVVVVNFWTGADASCVLSMPFLTSLQKRFDERGLVILAVCVDPEDELKENLVGLLHEDITVVVDPDGKIRDALDLSVVALKRLPVFLVLDGEGKIVERYNRLDRDTKIGIDFDVEALLPQLPANESQESNE